MQIVIVKMNTVISIHALLAESDQLNRTPPLASRTFLSTLSLRRATKSQSSGARIGEYFYPRSPCGERQPIFSKINTRGSISIHALLAESDVDYYAV